MEFGQIAVLIIVFLLLSMIRGEYFHKISKYSNWILVVAGISLLVYQLNGYFTDHTHPSQNELGPLSIILQTGNDIVVTTVGGNAPYVYEWNTGETTDQITPIDTGGYWVVVTDSNGFVSDTSFITFMWVNL